MTLMDAEEAWDVSGLAEADLPIPAATLAERDAFITRYLMAEKEAVQMSVLENHRPHEYDTADELYCVVCDCGYGRGKGMDWAGYFAHLTEVHESTVAPLVRRDQKT